MIICKTSGGKSYGYSRSDIEKTQIHLKLVKLFLIIKNILLFKNISPYGEYDGYILNEKSQIKRIVTKSNYLNYIQSILSSNNDTIKFTSKEDMISYAINNDKLLYVISSSWIFFKILKPTQLIDNILYCYELDKLWESIK